MPISTTRFQPAQLVRMGDVLSAACDEHKQHDDTDQEMEKMNAGKGKIIGEKLVGRQPDAVIQFCLPLKDLGNRE